jgi:hypothetical protein
VVTRRILSFLFASTLLFAGAALSVFEIMRADGLRPFVLFGALVMVVASGAWLLDEFVLPR